MQVHYLYAIVDRLPARWRPPASGVAGAPVVSRRLEDLVVLGSPLDHVPPASPVAVAQHRDVVATLAQARAALPFPYGTAVPAADVQDWVLAHRTPLRAALAAVRGRVEMTVRLLRLGGTGALRPLADALAERAALPEWRYRPSGQAGDVAASVAFLVPRAEVPGFLARIAPVASHADGVAVVPTGPWPPYSFVPELDGARVPYAAVGQAHPARRAG